MKVHAQIRDVTEREITPRGQEPFTVHQLVVETTDPLEIHEVRIPQDLQSQIQKLRDLSGQVCTVPISVAVRSGGYLSLLLNGMPDTAKSKATAAA